MNVSFRHPSISHHQSSLTNETGTSGRAAGAESGRTSEADKHGSLRIRLSIRLHSPSLASGFTQLFGKNAEAAKAKLQQIGLELLKQVVAQMMQNKPSGQHSEPTMYLSPRPQLQSAAQQLAEQTTQSPSKLQSQFSAQQPAEEKMYLFPRPKLQTAAQQLAEPPKHEFIRPQPQHFAAPPQQPSFFAPPQPQHFAAPPQQPPFFAPPQPQHFAAPPQQPPFFAPPQPQHFAAPPQQPSFFAPPQPQHFAAPPQQPPFFAPPQPQHFAAPPQQPPFFAPPQPQHFAAPPQQPPFFAPPQPQHFAAPPQQPPFAAPPQPSAESPQSHAQPQLALPPLESPAGHSPQQSQSVPQSSPEVTPEKAAYWAEPVAYEGPRLSMGGVRPSEAREHAKLLKQHLNDGQLKELHSDLLALSNTATEDMKSAFDEKYKNVFESKYDDNPAAFSVLGKVGLKESGGTATDSKFWSLASTHTPRN